MNSPQKARGMRVVTVSNPCLLQVTSEAVVASKGPRISGLAASELPCPQPWPLPS